MQYKYNLGKAKMATDSFFGLGRDTFTDLNSGIGTYQAGYSITESGNDGTPQFTASVIAGENGQGALVVANGRAGDVPVEVQEEGEVLQLLTHDESQGGEHGHAAMREFSLAPAAHVLDGGGLAE